MKPAAEGKVIEGARTAAVAHEAEMAPTSSVADMATDRAAHNEMLSATEWLSGVETICREKSYQQDLQLWNTLREQGGQVVDTERNPVLL